MAALDQVSAPVATALAAGIRGLADGIPAGAPAGIAEAARAAHARLVAHVSRPPPPAIPTRRWAARRWPR